MKCSICGIRIDSVEEAVEAGWTPSFFDGDQEHEVACRSCTETLLQIGEDGEWEVKEKFGGENQVPGGEKGCQDHLLIGIAVLENEPRKVN